MKPTNAPLTREERAFIKGGKAAGLSASKMARELGRSPETVRRFLRGDTHNTKEGAIAPSPVPGTPTNAEVEASAERLKKLLEG